LKVPARRPSGRRLSDPGVFRPDEADDPMNSVANLLDIFLVFIVALLVSFLSAYQLQDLLSQDSSVTIMKQTADGELTIVTKKATKIEAVKTTRTEAEGRGVRLGVAYRMEDGGLVYLPDEE
jgi:hypothetical protein